MDATQEKSYQKLVANLEELTKLYRTLLDTVRKEKDLLIAADIEKLNENNKSKEAILYKIRSLDSARERYAKEFADQIGGDALNPRLLDLAKVLHAQHAHDAEKRLRTIHSMLEMVVTRVAQLNKENEEYAQSALNTLNGAMGNIKETLAGKKTYARQGKMEYGPEKSGNFVRKEI